MYTELLPVSLEQKKTTINRIRNSTIPLLVNGEFTAESALHIFHYLATEDAQKGTIELEFLNDAYTAFFAGADKIPASKDQLDPILNELERAGNERFSHYGDIYQGDYRILGCFSPNKKLAKFNSELGEYFTASVPVSTRDYQYDDGPLYYPPIFNIHKLMASVGSRYDNSMINANNIRQSANAVATFYFWGLAMVHPFLGANHRAFDRFLEYSFAKKGHRLNIPQNETLNIPNDNPFNVELYKTRREFLKGASLDRPRFNPKKPEDIKNWLLYQSELNKALNYGINNDAVKLESVTDALLDWV